ncbi:ComEC/Rec2 family competence protein [Candidatus Daviesbacteria bacterium]|nr:ComEC/Rec2 family competence protein [Candidatus Daviesbacteria bacterium]
MVALLRWDKLPYILALILYLLIFYIRYQQGGWEVKIDVFQQERQFLDQKISQLLPSPQAELLSGILLGQNKSLPGSLKLSLRDTSTLHIVVASGQNLSMVGGVFLSLAGLIKRRNAIILSLLAISFYTVLTGMQIPIVRAAIMFSLAALAQLTGRTKDGVWVLAVTLGLMLLVNPSWITSISFQLSALATFGVIVVAPLFLRWLDKLPIIGQDLAVSLAAQVMVVPIIAQNFHQFSLVGIIANLFILWTIPFIMIGGVIMLGFSVVLNFIGGLVGVGVNILLTYFIYIVQFFASLPFAWEYIGEQLWLVWAGYYLIVGGILMTINKPKLK